MDPMPRSMVFVLVSIALIGVLASVVAYRLTPVPPSHVELAEQARRLSDDAGLDPAKTERLIAGCAGIVDGYSRLWQGLVSARYEACLREANLLK